MTYNILCTTNIVIYELYTCSMRLQTIKNKTGDEHFTKYIFKEMDLAKKKYNIPSDIPMYLLSTARGHEFFLCNGVVYIANNRMEMDKESNEPIVSSMELIELYMVVLHKEYPKTLKDIAFHIDTIKDPRYTFTPDEFLDWVDSPCNINHEIDAPYYEVIKFLNRYNKDTFRTDRYLFYSKRDADFNFINNLYAYDAKNQIEMKLYTFDDYAEFGELAWEYTPPLSLKDVVVDDLGQNISDYQKRECKKAFLKLANEVNPIFNVKNYWVMELVKLAVQPVLVLHEWSCHRCFCKPNLFGDIWVYDFPKQDEEPSFFIADKGFKKVAVLKFKSAEYLFKGIYKRGMAKAKGWELSKDEIEELIYFLNCPSKRAEDCAKGKLFDGYKKYVRTNWQQLIFEYNHNTAGWGWGEDGYDNPPLLGKYEDGIEQLPFNLPLPDYRKLIKG